MPRIAFIGAGSVIFTRKLLGDIVRFPALANSTFALHDIDADRLETAGAIARATNDALGTGATIELHLDRRAALDGADYVVNSIQVGMHEATVTDFEIPARYGVRQTIADTLGVGGVFRALRTFPVLEGIAADMRELCPDAWLLNYTNPMMMLCWYTYAGTPAQRVVGLCHSVQYSVRRLAALLGVPEEEVTFVSAGVNHQAFLLRFEHEGQSLYPRLDALLAADPQLRRRVRMDLYRRFGYYQTESSEHAAEYTPWYMRHDAMVDHHRLPIDEYVRRSEGNMVEYQQVRDLLASGGELPQLDRSVEYASEIINSIETGQPSVIYGNIRNAGLISNLPDDACVEVPCLVDRAGVQGTSIGDLPPQLVALNRTFLNVAELTVRAAIEQRPEYIRHAVMLDPNTSATLTLDEAWNMCDDLVEAHGDLLPEWARVRLGTGRASGPAEPAVATA